MDNNSNATKKLARSALLLAIAIVVQAIGSKLPPVVSQIVTGTIVNTVLLMTAYICGISYGIGVGVLTPVFAFILGQLAAPMGPFVPFIIIGNAIIVIIFGLFKSKGSWGKYVGIVLGAFFKFAFLFLSAVKIVKLLGLPFPAKVAANLAKAMGPLQLITALLGGIVSLIIIQIVVSRGKIQK